MSELHNALARIPLLAGVDPASASRLKGLTNVNFLVEVDGEEFVVRLPGAGTSEYIDRHAEYAAAKSASTAGVNAELIFFDPADGLMVTRFLRTAITMDADLFRDLGAVRRAGAAFRRLHTTAQPFTTNFDLFAMIDDYRQLLASKRAKLPDGYEQLQATAELTRAVLESAARPLVPSHCDPLCENFLDDGSTMYVIDYEYSANNDPMWDLADLSVEGGFSSEQDAALLCAYFGDEPANNEIGRMVAYKAMCDLLWTLWGVIQHVNGNSADDFWAYSTGRFARCRTLLSSSEYVGHLHDIQVS